MNDKPDIPAPDTDMVSRLGLGRVRRRWTKRHWIFAGIGGLVLILLLRWMFSGGDGIKYVTQPVTRGPLAITVSATGTLAPRDQVDVGAEVSGRLDAVNVDFNDHVKKGEVLAQINTDQLRAQLSQAQASLAQAKATVIQDSQTLTRYRALLQHKAISPQDLDKAIADLSRARASVKLAEAQAEQFTTQIAKATIRSPINGVVLDRKVEVGQTVAATFQTPVLFTLASDLSEMELDVDIDEADVGQVRAGQNATFTVDAYPTRTFTAKLDLGAQRAQDRQRRRHLSGRADAGQSWRRVEAGYDGHRRNPGRGHQERASGAERRAAFHPAGAGGDEGQEATERGEWRQLGPRLGCPWRRGDCGGSQARRLERPRNPGAGWQYQARRIGCHRHRHARDQRKADRMSAPPLIDIRGVKKIYGHGEAAVTALAGIDCRIEDGEFVAVMGPSGSGKSTFMNILGCLDTPTEGQYFFRGTDVGTLDRDQLALLRRYYIGFVFQGFNLLKRTTALENLELPLLYRGVPKHERSTRAMEALKQVGLEDRAHHTSAEMSGGQQQRVAIARALVTSPSVMFADEPTGNLNSKRSHEIMDLLTVLNRDRGLTIVLVTHEEDIADYAGRQIRFLDGRIASDTARQAVRA